MIEYRTAAGTAEALHDRLTGLVTPFGVETTIGDLKRGGFHEQIAPGAFTKTLQERDVVLLFNHDSNMPLARVSAGNLKLTQVKEGLRADADPVKTSYGKDLLDLTRAGVVKGMSFGFEVVKDSWADDEGRASDQHTGTRRTIHEIKLHEVSAVTFPAYPTTTLGVRDQFGGTADILEARVALHKAKGPGGGQFAGSTGPASGASGAKDGSNPGKKLPNGGAHLGYTAAQWSQLQGYEADYKAGRHLSPHAQHLLHVAHQKHVAYQKAHSQHDATDWTEERSEMSSPEEYDLRTGSIALALSLINGGDIAEAIDVLTDALPEERQEAFAPDEDEEPEGEDTDLGHRMADFKWRKVGEVDPAILEGTDDDLERMQDILKVAEFRTKF